MAGLDYFPTIGLEIHVQLATQSKIFCADSTMFDAEPNAQTSVVSLAHPGTLPVLNKEAVEMAIKMGLVVHSNIAPKVVFDRKHYFYPDSPKGYQITQNTLPICKGGAFELEVGKGDKKVVRIHQIHLEDDAGKSIHDLDNSHTLIDLNRAGMPLIEIVTEPDLSSAEEVGLLLEQVRKTVRFLEISNGNMEQGSLRCDVNISLRPTISDPFGEKVEIKNMNSIRFVKKAINYEIERQSLLLEMGKEVEQESRLFDADNGKTYGMREKEDANDYRYYPDPDLVPFEIEVEWLNELKKNLPKLPKELKKEFVEHYGLSENDAVVLSDSIFLSHQFKLLMKAGANPKRSANWLMGPVQSWNKGQGIGPLELPIESIVKLMTWVEDGKMSNTVATQTLLPALFDNYQLDIEQIARTNQLFLSASDDQLLDVVASILQEHKEEVKRFKQGKKGLLQLFVGKVMAATKGKADPKQVVEVLQNELNK